MTYTVSDDATAVHIPALRELFASAWWAATRTEDETRRVLAGSDVVITVTHDATGQLTGFARALTDDTCIALILDVIVAPTARGTGVGALIMDAVLSHPRIAGVRSVELVCQPDLIDFYRRWGFTDQVGASRLMRHTTDPALSRPSRSLSPSASRPSSPAPAPAPDPGPAHSR